MTAQGYRLRNDLYCVEWDVKLYYTTPHHTILMHNSIFNQIHNKITASDCCSTRTS